VIEHAFARAADAAALAALHAAAFPRGWSREEFKSLLRERQNSAFVARSDGNTIGFVLARRAADEAEILSITVAEAHRRQGIAQGLMHLLFGDFARLGVGAVFLEVGADNEPALRLYARLGFAEVGRRAGYYAESAGPAMDALVLRAAIAPLAGVAAARAGSRPI